MRETIASLADTGYVSRGVIFAYNNVTTLSVTVSCCGGSDNDYLYVS